MKTFFVKAARVVARHLPKQTLVWGVGLSTVGILSAGCVGPIPQEYMFHDPNYYKHAPRTYVVPSYYYNNSYRYDRYDRYDRHDRHDRYDRHDRDYNRHRYNRHDRDYYRYDRDDEIRGHKPRPSRYHGERHSL